VRKFADDTKMVRIVNNQEDANELQKDLDKLGEWATKWEMEFNAKNVR
jgi:hypothetical protein